MEQNLIPWRGGHQGAKPVNEIYVVDDDEYMREILEVGLAAQGFPVKTFEDGDAFLQATTERIPICVFLDVVMPRRSGLEILQELRARRYWTPVFLTSARADVQTVVEAMKNGAHDYIPKPFDPRALVPRVNNAVEMWLSRVEMRDASDISGNDNREWFRLTSSEKEMLLLMRLMRT
jgi:FixJ family two-component response regulator